MKKLFTSESVTEGHPDKVADQISDSILDAYLKEDPDSRVACETAISCKGVLVMGEITSKGKIDVEKIVRDTIINIGYDKDEYGFNGHTCPIRIELNKQSSDIALGVDNSLETKEGGEVERGAGDQGMMFGYATNETPELMPLPISLAHKLARKLTEVRKNKTLPYLRPDGKTQVTIEYENDVPVRVSTIVISNQHNPEISLEQMREDIKKEVIEKTVPKDLIDENTLIYVNPTGRFVIGGPAGDSGLTGRKIIVDTYGGSCSHGGGAFSGKDYTKVDRSAAYYARYVAKNIVAAGLADKCEIQVSYAIGVAKPISIYVNTYNTGKENEQKIEEIINKVFDFRPSNIIKELDLKQPIYKNTAAYGHFGQDKFNWEKTNKKEEIQKYVANL